MGGDGSSAGGSLPSALIGSDSFVEHSGWMKRRVWKMGYWSSQRFFFVLYGNGELHQVEDKETLDVKTGATIRDVARDKRSKEMSDYAFELRVENGRKVETWVLDPGERDEWLKWEPKLRKRMPRARPQISRKLTDRLFGSKKFREEDVPQVFSGQL